MSDKTKIRAMQQMLAKLYAKQQALLPEETKKWERLEDRILNLTARIDIAYMREMQNENSNHSHL